MAVQLIPYDLVCGQGDSGPELSRCCCISWYVVWVDPLALVVRNSITMSAFISVVIDVKEVRDESLVVLMSYDVVA